MKNKTVDPATANGVEKNSEVIVVINWRECFDDFYLETLAKMKGWAVEYLSDHLSEISPTDLDLIAIVKSFEEFNGYLHTIEDIKNNYCNNHLHLVSLPRGTRFIIAWYNSEDSYYSGEHIVLLDSVEIFTA